MASLKFKLYFVKVANKLLRVRKLILTLICYGSQTSILDPPLLFKKTSLLFFMFFLEKTEEKLKLNINTGYWGGYENTSLGYWNRCLKQLDGNLETEIEAHNYLSKNFQIFVFKIQHKFWKKMEK